MQVFRGFKRWVTGAMALGAVALAPSAQAIVVYSGVVNIAIPNTTAGLYVNVIDGSTYSGPNTFPALGGPGANFDFNLFGSSLWTAFSPTTSGQSAPTVPVTSRGYVASSATGGVLNLAAGTVIGGSSVFNTGSPTASAITTGGPAVFGFRFRNENDLSTAADDTVHYGWARVILSNGVPGTLVDYAFESSALTAITTPIPEPSAMLLAGLGVAGLLARTRRRITA